jgi:hypothetical protein
MPKKWARTGSKQKRRKRHTMDPPIMAPVMCGVILGHGFNLVKEDFCIKLAGDLGAELFDTCCDYLIFWRLEELSQCPFPV